MFHFVYTHDSVNSFQLPCCAKDAPDHVDTCPSCPTCYDKLENVVNHLLKVAGGVGLFFSFTLVST